MDKEILELNRITKYPKIQTLWLRDKNFKAHIGHINPKLESLKNVKNFILTEKYHGTNLGIIITPEKRVFIRKRSAIIAERFSDNVFARMPDQTNITHYIDCVRNIDFDVVLNYFEESKSLIIIFGEGVGKKIQKEGETYTNSYDFIVFDVKCGNSFFDWKSVIAFCKKTGLRCANSTEQWDDILKCNFEAILKARNKERFVEGYVVRSEPPMLNQFGARMMFKIKYKDFRDASQSRA